MAVPVFHASSELPRLVLLCGAGICFALAACQRNEASPPAAQVKNERSDTRQRSWASLSAAPVTEDRGKIVVLREFNGSPQAIVSITYRANQNSDATCALQITEAGKVVAENRAMIECGQLTSPAMVDVTLSGTTKDLTIFQQKTKQTNSYSLKRIGDGEWIVTKAEFVYPQDNADTGEVDVVRETADLISMSPPTSVNRFDRHIIENRVVKSVMQ